MKPPQATPNIAQPRGGVKAKKRRPDPLREMLAKQPRRPPRGELLRYGPGFGWDFLWFSEIDRRPVFAFYRREPDGGGWRK